MTYLSKFIRFVFDLFAPVITVVIGGAIMFWGASIENDMLFYFGAAIFCVGMVWCFISYGFFDL